MTTTPQTPVLGYILKGYPRISETFISNEILLLEQLGFSMRLFSMRQPREDFCPDSVKRIKAQVDYLQNVAGDCNTPIYCIYHGIDLHLFQQDASVYPSNDRVFNILSVARITEKKDWPWASPPSQPLCQPFQKFSSTEKPA